MTPVTPGIRGLYEGTDKEGTFIQIPRNCDPAQDGTSLVSNWSPIFDVSSGPDSIPIEEFDQLLEEKIPSDVMARIDHVLEAGTFLASKGLADTPPLELREWRRGMILSWSHARDLEIAHAAIGHPRKLYNKHDVDEVVLAKYLKHDFDKMDPWYRDYVKSLDDGAWVNIGFFNPHISASLYKWGDAKLGTQNAMDAHRLSAHHNGSPTAPLDWVERAVNFVVHHIPREHWGIRHEPRGSWADLEGRLATDPAIKNSTIGQVIARDAAKLYELLEKEGKVVPWGLLKVPDTLPHSMVEHAFLVVKAARKVHTLSPADIEEYDEDEAVNPERVSRAKDVLTNLPNLIEQAKNQGRDDLTQSYQSMQEEINA